MHCGFLFFTRASGRQPGETPAKAAMPRIGKAPGSMPKQACAVRCLRRFSGTESCLPCVRRAPAAALFRTFAKQLPQRPRCGSDFPKKPPPRAYSEKPGKYTRLKSGSAKTPLYRAPAVFQSRRERHRALLPGLTPAKRSSSPPPPRRAAVRYESLSGLTRQPQRSSARPQSASQSPPRNHPQAPERTRSAAALTASARKHAYNLQFFLDFSLKSVYNKELNIGHGAAQTEPEVFPVSGLSPAYVLAELRTAV